MAKPYCILLMFALSLVSCKATPTITDTQTATTTKLLFDGEAVGCGFFFVYKSTQDKTKTVMVSGELGKINLTKVPETIDINDTSSLEICLADYGEKGYLESPCNASVPSRPVLQKIQAASGKVTIFITREKIKGNPNTRSFAITVILENVIFPVPGGGSYYVERAEIEDVVVGRQTA